MLKNRLLFGISYLMLLGFLVATNSSKVLIILTLYTIAFLCAVTLLLLTKRKVKLLLSLSNKKDITELLLCKNTALPIGLVHISIQYENGLYQTKETYESFLYAGLERESVFEIPWNHDDCGNYHLAIRKVRIYDILGICCVKGEANEPLNKVIYPVMPDIQLLQGQQTRLAKDGDRYDKHHSGNDVSEVFAMRDYQEGDSLNHVHWKLSSKIDKLIVREFGKPYNDELTLLCDCGFWGFEKNHELVNGVIGMTAAISRSLIERSIGHQACTVQGENMIEKKIHHQNDVIDFTTQLLSLHLREATNAYGLWRINSKTERSVLITGFLQEELLAELGKKTDLMVVLLTKQGEEHVEARDGYRLLALPISTYLDGRIQNIEI